MSDDMPLVSVVIPSKNRPEFVVKAIKSVFAQTYRNVEIVVVDDGSDTPLAEMLKNEFDSKIIVLRHEKSLGAPAARNTGIKHAKGEYVAFLDDDDVWLSEKIERQLHIFSENPALGLVFCGEDIVCNDVVIKRRIAIWGVSSARQMLFSNIIGGTSTVLIRADVLIEIFFDVTLPSCQDWDLFLRLANRTEFRAISEPLIQRTIHGEQISNSLSKRISGREMFYEKHKRLYEFNPKARSQFFRRMGSLIMLKGEKAKARDYFLQALKVCPFDYRNVVFTFVSFLFPRYLSVTVLSRYAVTRVDGYVQYH